MTTRMEEQYKSTIKPKLKEQFGYGNDLQVPRIEKIVTDGHGRPNGTAPFDAAS